MNKGISRARRLTILVAAAMLMALFIGTMAVHAGTITEEAGKVTLNNYKGTESLNYSDATELVLVGDNEITVEGGSAIVCADLTISGTGSLKLNGPIVANNSFKMKSGTVSVDLTNNGGAPVISSLEIKISGGKFKGAGSYISAIQCENIEITNGAEVTLSNAVFVINTNSLLIDNATVNVTTKVEKEGVPPYYPQIGIYSMGNVTIRNNAKVTAYAEGCAIQALGTLAIDHSYVEASVDSDYTFNNSPSIALGVYDSGGMVPGTEGLVSDLKITNAELKIPAGGKAGEYTRTTPGPDGEPMASTVKTILDKNGDPAKEFVLEPVHKWDAGKVTKAPTMSAAGVKTYTCSVCGETKTEAIPKLSSAENFAPGADAAVTEACILALPNDKDPAGSAFGLLQLKAAKTTKNSIKLTWKKAPGAKKYIIYSNACGKGKKYQKLTTVTGKSTTVKKVAGKKLAKGKYYKFLMVAVDANNKVVTTSKTVHAATLGGKVGNDKKVTTKAKKNKVTIKAKKTFKLAAKTVAANKKLKVKKHRAVSYETSNAKVATVSKKGVIKGVKKGTCKVYAYAQDGVCAVIKVTVK